MHLWSLVSGDILGENLVVTQVRKEPSLRDVQEGATSPAGPARWAEECGPRLRAATRRERRGGSGNTSERPTPDGPCSQSPEAAETALTGHSCAARRRGGPGTGWGSSPPLQVAPVTDGTPAAPSPSGVRGYSIRHCSAGAAALEPQCSGSTPSLLGGQVHSGLGLLVYLQC